MVFNPRKLNVSLGYLTLQQQRLCFCSVSASGQRGLNRLATEVVLKSTRNFAMKTDTIYSRFRQIRLAYPDAPAVIEEDRTLSYAELDSMVDCVLASFIDKHPRIVGIVMSHGAMQIAAVFLLAPSARDFPIFQPPTLSPISFSLQAPRGDQKA